MESSSSIASLPYSTLPVERLSPGFKTDFECLVKHFEEVGSLEFSTFTMIWRSMKMSMISTGRLNEKELRQFIEECLIIITSYLHPQNKFLYKTAAFYFLYSFYITQPQIPKSKIRLTLRNWSILNKYIEEAISHELHDVEFIFHKLCAIKAFLYVAPPNDISQGHGVSELLEEDDDDDDDVFMNQFFKKNSSSLENIFSNDNIEQLSAIHKQYQEMKCILTGIEMPSPDSSVNMLDTNTATTIAKLMEEFKNESKLPKDKLTRQKKQRHKIKNKKIKLQDSFFDSIENELGTDKMPETSAAGTSYQLDLSTEGEDNSSVNYQLAEENDSITCENSKDNDNNKKENMQTQENSP